MEHTITFKVNTTGSALASVGDEHLAQLWHIGQANPADFGDADAGVLAESVGREIILRWLKASPIALHTHQGRDFAAAQAIRTAARASSEEPSQQPTTSFVPVPETTLPGGIVVPAFQVGQYATSRSADGVLTINGTDKPWTNINFADAKAAALAAGYKLITELQWLAIAWRAAQVGRNWSGGAVGAGKLHQGIRFGSGARAGDQPQQDEREQRWLSLSDEHSICDFNGNVFQWVFDDVQGDAQGLIAKTIAADSPSRAVALAAGAADWRAKGLGWQPDNDPKRSGGALVRGGCFGSGDDAGVFDLDGVWPGGADGGVGFRCTK